MNIKYTYKDIHNWVKNVTLFLVMMIMSITTYAQTPEYASYIGSNTAGSGNFTCTEMPGFTYSITGDFATGDTAVPGPDPQVVDNDGGGMESVYGEADQQQNIEVEVAGYGAGNGDGIGDPITNTVTTTLTFNAQTPPDALAFMILDVEQDQVMICALDANGNAVSAAVIDSWYQGSFDADNSEAGPIVPAWDASMSTLVGQTTNVGDPAPGAVKQTNYVADLPDNEAGAAWFQVNIPITQLQFKSQALGVAPDDPSQHFYIATTCEAPTPCEAPNCDPVPNLEVCADGTTRTIGCEAGLENGNVVWFDGMGNQVGVGCDLVIDNTMIENGAIGDMMCFYYIATDANGCDIASCCPIIAEVVDCGFYDLAIIKEESSVGPYSPGDDVTYTLTVENQGTLDASNIEITDLIPSDMTLSAADANGWVSGPAGSATVIIANLPANTSTTIDIVLTIDPSFMGTEISNNAVISADDGDDIDSDPTVNVALDDYPDNDSLTESDGGDDEDPELIQVEQVFDLALIKETSSAGLFAPGDDVTFTITVTNQGTLDATSFEITDYIPNGLILNDANWTGAGSTASITNGPLAAGASTTVDITFTIDPSFQGDELINFAEISADANALNIVDSDSVPDPTNGNDAGGNPDSPSDDVVMGDGTGTPGDSVPATDEDDHDPEAIQVGQVFDLALIKEEASVGPYTPGQDVTYSISVTNQGTVDATSFTLTDYIPTGLTLSNNDANGWTGAAAGPVSLVVGALPVGATATIDIVLTIDPSYQGLDAVNFAEISADANTLGLADVDSTPDAMNGNDAGGNPASPSDDVVGGDGSGAPGDNNAATDEDDHDPELIEIIQIFDLALIKEESSSEPYSPGDDVTYTISVVNQGNLDATSFEVTDYLPAGMTLSTADNNGWSGPAAGPLTVTGGALASGSMTTIDIVLTIDPNFQGDELINFAEISADANVVNVPDVDSSPDAMNGNDAGGNPDSASDDELGGDGSGTPGDNNAATDEDDHDPELVEVTQIFDLALIKELSSAGPFTAGDDVTYTISVTNQGTVDATSFTVTDYIPTDMTLSNADANGWTGGPAGPVSITSGALAAGATTTIDIVLTIDPAYQGTELVNFAEISADDNALALPDVDSTPDATNGNDAGGNPDTPSDDVVNGDGSGAPNGIDPATDEDDHDPEAIQIEQRFDLALIKQVSSAGPYNTGDNVTYTITVCNQGTLDGVDIEVIDYIPTGMTLSGADANGWIGAVGGPVTNTIASVPVNSCSTVDIVLTIDPNFMGTSIVNFAEIIADNGDDVDSTPDPTNGNDAGGNPGTPSDNVVLGDGTGAPNDIDPATDEDDHDPEEIMLVQTFDLALIKQVSSAGPFNPGDDVTYTITVTNQGTVNATSFEITDYIPTGLMLNDADWTQSGSTATITNGALAAGASTTVDITFTIDPGFQGEEIVNFAEISDDANSLGLSDVDSTPDPTNGNDAGGNPDSPSDDVVNGDGTGAPNGTDPATDEDDHDPELISLIQLYDLALIKTESSARPYFPGDNVTYTIEVCNQGTLDAANVIITDYVPAGMTLSATDANGWIGQPAGPVINSVASLPVGVCSTLDIELTIDDNFAGGTIVNFAEISNDDGDDVDSTPNQDNTDDAGGNVNSPSDNELNGDGSGASGDSDAATDEDDHDPEDIVVDIFDLALTKAVSSSTPGPFMPGDVVTFDITVENQGTVNAFNVNINDYIPTGLILADNNWTDNGGTATLNAPIGFIPTGGSSTVSITFQIDPAFGGATILNDSEISEADSDTNPNNTAPDDIDSTPSDNFTPDDLPGNDDITDPNGGDDQDPEQIMVDQPVDIFDLALAKTINSSTPGPYAPGDVITYDVTVTNQGNVNAFNIGLVDYIPAGLILADSDWTAVGASATLNTPISFLAAGASTTVEITFQIDPAFGGATILNDSEISEADDDTNPNNADPTDVDSTPADDLTPDDLPGNDDITDMTGGDDQDPEQIMVDQPVDIFDLALAKTVSSSTPAPYVPGDVITYELTVTNQGNVNAFNIGLVDYIPAGLILADSDWTAVGASATLNTPISFLAAGASTTVEVTFQIDPAFGGASILNDSEISEADDDTNPNNADPTDVDSTPADDLTPDDLPGNDDITDMTGGDDQDPEQIMVDQPVDIFDLALTKTVNTATPGPYAPGDVITFDLTVVNQGSVNAFAISLIDDIPTGLILADGDWTDNGGVASLNAPISFLASGATTVVTITFQIDPNFTGISILNDSEISAADDDTNPNNAAPIDIDSTPGDDLTPDDLPGNNDLSDPNGGDDQDPEEIVVCGAAEAGIVAEGSQNSCLVSGSTVSRNAIASGQVVPNGFELIYILVDDNGNILQTSSMPAFTLDAVGIYTIHPVVYNPIDFDASTATTVTEILDNSTCVAIDLVGSPADVEECCLANAGGLVDAVVTSCVDNGAGSMALLEATAVGQNIPAGYVLSYILTSQPGSVVVDINNTGSFLVSTAGMYSIQTLVHDPNTYNFEGLTVGVDDIFSVLLTINELQVCADINLVGIDLVAEECEQCPFNLYIPGIALSVSPGLYEAENDITSDGTINIGTVEYSAGNSVELLPGFEVVLGNEFEAYIEGCQN